MTITKRFLLLGLFLSSFAIAQETSWLTAPGLDYPNNDLQEFDTNEISACQQRCGETPECKLAAFVTSINRCYLKSTAGFAVSNPDVTSLIPFTAYRGIDMPFHDIREFNAGTAEACQLACVHDSGCRAVVYREDGNCWLKSLANTAEQRPMNDMTTFTLNMRN